MCVCANRGVSAAGLQPTVLQLRLLIVPPLHVDGLARVRAGVGDECMRSLAGFQPFPIGTCHCAALEEMGVGLAALLFLLGRKIVTPLDAAHANHKEGTSTGASG